MRVVSSELEKVRMEQYHCHALKSWRKSYMALGRAGTWGEQPYCEGRDIAVRVDIDGKLPCVPVAQGSDERLQDSWGTYNDGGAYSCARR